MNANNRTSPYDIDPIFLERWSPRAFTTESLPKETLLTMLEAARWAASSSNAQPWRFIYALRDSPRWSDFVALLAPGNQDWAKNAAALVFVGSAKTIKTSSGEERPSPTHAFDAGAASACMVFQALKLGWHTHGMAGFDHDRAHSVLNVPDKFEMDAVFAIGKLGPKISLSAQLQAREIPSDRAPLEQIAFDSTM